MIKKTNTVPLDGRTPAMSISRSTYLKGLQDLRDRAQRESRDLLTDNEHIVMSKLRFFDPDFKMKTPQQYQQVMALLKQFCDELVVAMENKVNCIMDFGCQTGIGQEWRITVKCTTSSRQLILLRAYVPIAGIPMMLEISDSETMTTCDSSAALALALEKFGKSHTTEQTLDMFFPNFSLQVKE